MAETSRTADHALAVLLELAEHGPLNPAEVARRLGLNRTVTHRLLTTLELRDFVHRTPVGFAPGAALVRMAERVHPTLRAAAAIPMSLLCDAIGETVVLHVVDGDDAVVVDERVSRVHLLRVEHEIGSRHPIVAGASGRALLAFLSPTSRERSVRRCDDPALVRRRLAEVREQGYALSHDELQNGVHGLSVPVLGPEGSAVASLAVIAPANRSDGLLACLSPLREAATTIAAVVAERDDEPAPPSVVRTAGGPG